MHTYIHTHTSIQPPAPLPRSTASLCTRGGGNSCGSCGWQTSETGVLAFGNAGSFYSTNLECEWIIAPASGASVSLTFPPLQLEPQFDFVSVYSCSDSTCATITLLMEFTGDYSFSHTFTGTAYYVRFRTDGSSERPAFTASWTTSGSPDVGPTPVPTPSSSLWPEVG